MEADVLDNLATAVRRARDCLTSSPEAVLFVDGLEPGAETVAALYERDGVPHLACDANSSIVDAARGALEAVLEVDAGDGVTAVFTGRLALVAPEQVAGTTVDIVELQLTSVQVEHAVYTRTISLAEYFEADEDLEGYAIRLTEHTNSTHGADLRAFVARRCGQPADRIAAAWCERITGAGVTVGWLDGDGAHRSELTFDLPARCPLALVTAMRGLFG